MVDDGIQNYLVFQPIYRCLKKIDNPDRISLFRCEGLFHESIKPLASSNNSHAPALNYVGNKTTLKFDGSCLTR